MTRSYKYELVNKYSKYVKTIRNRIIEVEFNWFQVNPYQSFQKRITEKEYIQSKKYINSKKLLNMSFEQFIDLITPIFASNVSEISDTVLHSIFECLFDQNSNGIIDRNEFESLLILLHGLSGYTRIFRSDKLHQTFQCKNNHITYKEFYDCVKSGYLRELLMN